MTWVGVASRVQDSVTIGVHDSLGSTRVGTRLGATRASCRAGARVVARVVAVASVGPGVGARIVARAVARVGASRVGASRVGASRVGASSLLSLLPLALAAVVGVHHPEVGQHLLGIDGVLRVTEKGG